MIEDDRQWSSERTPAATWCAESFSHRDGTVRHLVRPGRGYLSRQGEPARQSPRRRARHGQVVGDARSVSAIRVKPAVVLLSLLSGLTRLAMHSYRPVFPPTSAPSTSIARSSPGRPIRVEDVRILFGARRTD